MQVQNFDSARTSDIVDALQRDLASIGDDDQMPDFETAYSQLGATSNPSTNLNEVEVRTIRAVILERRQQLDEVQLKASNLGLFDESDHVRQLRRRLLEQEDKIIESQKTHRRLISALWRLPTEILSLIFVFCLPDDKYMLSHPEKAPVLLTRVCRRWREVAVDMPNLWCKLSVGENIQQPGFCCNTWLERTRGHPLSVALWCDRNNHWIESRKTLQPYVLQVTSLALVSQSGVSLPVITDFIALEELIISPDPTHPIEDIAHSMSQSPSTLRSLNIPRLLFELRFFSAFKPALWTHLTSVEITVDKPRTFRRLLRLCPNLSSLSVGIYPHTPRVCEPLTHTKLQTLRIVTGEWHNRELFNLVSFPGLRLLEVRDVKLWPHKDFTAFLTRSNCSLERLILGPGVTTTEEQRAEYVAVIPSLEVVVDHRHPTHY
ncbi:hypothetical protein DEU56DRAFT_838191 [Suillus clintonianus]|uniref:uncharacterized protein n=1 Tax=Suillus clintonianus TaxID=1904413 RepID=UPI001B86246F|nr:uncharacterized protein DEU56DRAFT_838191 [Suillus clintonianus]KAG2118401.1 hypothetical protein DEU56DRAFT_838191 [Suillus clintonianus]